MKGWRAVAVALLFFNGFTCQASGRDAERNALFLYPMVQSFRWEEPDVRVKETGMLYGLGAQGRFRAFHPAHMLLYAELFGGEVDYDGTRMDSSPFESKSLYAGVKAGMDAGVPIFEKDNARIMPFAGVGGRWWRRRLDYTDGQKFGYDEDWLSLSVRTGLEAYLELNNDWSLRAAAAIVFPFYNRENVYLETRPGSSSFTLHPGRKPSPIAELGVGFRDYRLVLFYEQLKFSASDVDPSGYYQPESKAEIVGIRLGVSL